MTDLAIPSELTYTELSRMYPSRKMELRRQPFNASSFTQGNMIQLTIPKMDKAYLNCATNCLTYNINFTITTGANAVVDADHPICLYSSAWSPFRRYVLKQSGGQDLDQIDNANALVHKVLDMTMNPVEKEVNVSMGFNSIGAVNIGHRFETGGVAINSTRNVTASFSIPLIGILGATEKFIPLNTADLELNLTIDQNDEFLYFTDLPASATVTNISISNVEFVGEVLQMEDSGHQQLLAMNPDGFKVKTQSWSYASGGSLPSGASGVQDLVVPFSLSSMKQFIWSCQPSNMWDKKYGGVNPNLSSYQLLIGGSPYPVQPVNAGRLAEVYYQNSKSFGAFYSSSHSGCAVRSTLAKASTAYNGEYTAYTQAAPATAALIETFSNSNKFVCSLDLEHINQAKMGLYTGISSRGSTNTLRLNVQTALAAVSHAIHMFASYDVQLTFDWRNQQVLYSN